MEAPSPLKVIPFQTIFLVIFPQHLRGRMTAQQIPTVIFDNDPRFAQNPPLSLTPAQITTSLQNKRNPPFPFLPLLPFLPLAPLPQQRHPLAMSPYLLILRDLFFYINKIIHKFPISI